MDASWDVYDNGVGWVSALRCMRCGATLAYVIHEPGTPLAAIAEAWEERYAAVARLAEAHAGHCPGRG